MLFCVARSQEAVDIMKIEADRQKLRWIPRYHVSSPWAHGTELPPDGANGEISLSQVLVIRLLFKEGMVCI